MREKLDELARLHAHRFDDDVALSAWREATIGDAFPAILAYVRGLTAERDQLRAENERLKEAGRIAVETWQFAAKQLTARCDEAERERDEAQAHAADLRAALDLARVQFDWVRQNSKPPVNGYSESAIWAVVVTAGRDASSALARTPAQSLGRIKAEALRSVAEQYIKPFLGFNEGWYGDGVRDAYNAVKDAAEELKKEATDAR
jgi:hypothetical protein